MSEQTYHSDEAVEAPIIDQALQQGASIEWQRYSDSSAGVVINQPGVGKVIGTLNDHGEGLPRSLYVDMFTADTPGQGAGKQLLELLMQEGKKYRATSMSGHFTSQAALGAFASIVGRPDEISFYERLSGKPVDITLEEAMDNPASYIASATFPNDASAH